MATHPSKATANALNDAPADVRSGAEIIALPRKHRCGRCGETDLSRFGKNSKHWSGQQTWCRRCSSEYRKHKRKTDPEVARRDRERAARWNRENPNTPSRTREGRKNYQYGIDFESMWRAQEGNCAACGEPMTTDNSAMGAVVDHDHKCCARRRSCGRCVRGLLHRSCNSVLGLVFDNPNALRRLAEYLEESL